MVIHFLSGLLEKATALTCSCLTLEESPMPISGKCREEAPKLPENSIEYKIYIDLVRYCMQKHSCCYNIEIFLGNLFNFFNSFSFVIVDF